MVCFNSSVIARSCFSSDIQAGTSTCPNCCVSPIHSSYPRLFPLDLHISNIRHPLLALEPFASSIASHHFAYHVEIPTWKRRAMVAADNIQSQREILVVLLLHLSSLVMCCSLTRIPANIHGTYGTCSAHAHVPRNLSLPYASSITPLQCRYLGSRIMQPTEHR